MNTGEALKKLDSLGTAQTRKTYGRHGVTGKMFGVKYGDLYKLVKQIGVDHKLGLGLWKSGNHDARVLATMILDPEKVTAKDLNAWVKDLDNHALRSALADLLCKCVVGRKAMRRWLDRKGEWHAATAWSALSRVAALPGDVPGAVTKEECRGYLAEIEERIHGSANAVKYAMNNALIALGAYIPGLEKAAVSAANRIGEVEVDHGLTSCQTPRAAPYIVKAASRHRAKMKTAAERKKKKAAAKKKSGKKASAQKRSALGKPATASRKAATKTRAAIR